jgi:hypothetical protein
MTITGADDGHFGIRVYAATTSLRSSFWLIKLHKSRKAADPRPEHQRLQQGF